jgi:hypothetical protein
MGGGTDLALSFSGSSSATSGAKLDQRFGDFIVGGAKKTPPWAWLAVAGMALVAVTVFLVRR